MTIGPIFLDPTILLIIPAFLLSLYAQSKVTSTFNKYAQVASKRGMNGAQVAACLLEAANIRDVRIEAVHGQLSDHYDPQAKAVRLSEPVYGKTSLAALGVAAHEVGHAIQHNDGYAPLNFRSGLLPAANIGSKMAIPLLLIGMLFATGSGGIGDILVYTGIGLFSAVVLFQLVTLPVEFNASRRAIALLERHGIISAAEAAPTKKVLDAAAMTYVAAAVSSLLTLIRFILIARRRD